MANYPFYQPQMQQQMQNGPYQPVYNPYMPPQPPQPVQQPVQGMQPPMQQIPSAQQVVPTQGNANAGGGFACIPVTSREEAVATRVEAFGPPVLMPDMGHGMIYYKRFNDKTALADFAEFKLVPENEQQPSQKEQKPEVDLMALVGAFQSRFDAIDGKFDGMDSKFGKIEGKVDNLTEKFENRARRKVVVKGADDE